VRRWHLPSRLIALLIVAVLGCGAGLIYFVVSYSNLAQKTEELFYLEQTAHQQQKEDKIREIKIYTYKQILPVQAVFTSLKFGPRYFLAAAVFNSTKMFFSLL